MKNKLFIPEKIKAGYQDRSDTFTKKLAYVIYYDEKGVLRKEKSWNSWRDNKIEPLDLDNKPHGGFTLNKGILRDGYWGGGHNMVRIYDDRGIEFEITISNLMYILMGNDCNKRVLDGEFVYAWDGTELVLLPTNTEEYKVSQTFTALKTNKVTSKELQANTGCIFKTKNLENWVYLGKIEYNEKKWNSQEKEYKTTWDKKHIYYNLDTNNYFTESQVSKLAYLMDSNKVDNFEELLEGYFKSKHYIRVEEVIVHQGREITKYFTDENYQKFFDENDKYKSEFFTDGKTIYHGYYPHSVHKIDNLVHYIRDRYNSYSNEYWHVRPKETDYNSAYKAYFENNLQNYLNPKFNNGYNEHHVQKNGIKFHILDVTVKTTDGQLIKINDNLREYFFLDKEFKFTINR